MVTGNYYSPWKNCEDKLKNSLLHTGDYFQNYSINLCLLYSLYISTNGAGSNIINKYHSTKNVHKCHQDFELHFWNDAYLTNKATAATITRNSAVYHGDCRTFTFETYYTIMYKDFNDLSYAVSSHALNNAKKINAFEQGLKDPQAIIWCIILK